MRQGPLEGRQVASSPLRLDELPNDVLALILDATEPAGIPLWCSALRRMRDLCDKEFFRRRLRRDFPGMAAFWAVNSKEGYYRLPREIAVIAREMAPGKTEEDEDHEPLPALFFDPRQIPLTIFSDDGGWPEECMPKNGRTIGITLEGTFESSSLPSKSITNDGTILELPCSVYLRGGESWSQCYARVGRIVELPFSEEREGTSGSADHRTRRSTARLVVTTQRITTKEYEESHTAERILSIEKTEAAEDAQDAKELMARIRA